jgi:6-phosphogluconolactonase
MKNNFHSHFVAQEAFNDFCVDWTSKRLESMIEKKEQIYVALSGGSTPIPILTKVSEARIDWSKICFFMVDERNVPIDDPHSNFGNLERCFFDKITSQAYPMITNVKDLEYSVSNYEKEIKRQVKDSQHEFPSFDLIFLGMGDDGHTASLFPGTKALSESEKIVVKNYVPKFDAYRATLTYPVIQNAQEIVVMIKGAAKNKIYEEIVSGNGQQYPITKIVKSKAKITWIIGR